MADDLSRRTFAKRTPTGIERGETILGRFFDCGLRQLPGVRGADLDPGAATDLTALPGGAVTRYAF